MILYAAPTELFAIGEIFYKDVAPNGALNGEFTESSEVFLWQGRRPLEP